MISAVAIPKKMATFKVRYRSDLNEREKSLTKMAILKEKTSDARLQTQILTYLASKTRFASIRLGCMTQRTISN